MTVPTERRSAMWPWLVMPLAALAIFCTLYKVRHATQGGPGASTEATRSAAADDQ